MKNAVAILGLVLMSSTVFASKGSLLGTYSTKSATRAYGYTKDLCISNNGSFDESDKACYFSAGNTIEIKENNNRDTLVKISIVYGAARELEFYGVVTVKYGNVLIVQEANVDESDKVKSILKEGCTLQVTVRNNTAVIDKNSCEPGLSMVSGAKKVN